MDAMHFMEPIQIKGLTLPFIMAKVGAEVAEEAVNMLSNQFFHLKYQEAPEYKIVSKQQQTLSLPTQLFFLSLLIVISSYVEWNSTLIVALVLSTSLLIRQHSLLLFASYALIIPQFSQIYLIVHSLLTITSANNTLITFTSIIIVLLILSVLPLFLTSFIQLLKQTLSSSIIGPLQLFLFRKKQKKAYTD